MRVLVLGAGLLGVTSAYYLQQLGHEVTVVDRHATPAAKARGLASTGLAPDTARLLQQSAASPSAPAGWKELRRQVRRHMGRWLGTSIRLDPSEHLIRLAAYSRASARALHDEVGIPAGGRNAGLLHFYTDAEAFQGRLARQPHWDALGCEERLLSAEEALDIEPALRGAREALAGAAYAAEDPVRDPAQFAASLVFLCRAAGVRFLTRHQVLSLQERAGRIEHVEALDAAGRPLRLEAHGYVLALGASSALHAGKLGIPIPLRFVREYVLTLPVRDPGCAPHVALHDRQARLHIRRTDTPAGDCLRVSATARDTLDPLGEPDPDLFEKMLDRVRTLLPGAVDLSQASRETTLDAVSRSGLPMIGKTRVGNFFLNTAPGGRSWINACGAGKSIARIMSGLRPELEFAFRGL